MAMANESSPIWHEGELSVQKKVGTDQLMAQIGPKFIRQFMPQQHRDFFESLTMIFIGYDDHRSLAQASVLFGAVGFIQSPSDTELVINTQNTMGDFLPDFVDVGDRIGLLGIEFETKRRNRVNVIVVDVGQKMIKVKVLQSYGNCPKYIQPKTLLTNRHYGEFSTQTRHQFNEKDLDIITNADTFFIASRFNDGKTLNNRGADISHRGGKPGFVKINADGQLLVEDYVGNGFYNTLGNLHLNPIASLLFVDWQHGDGLQIMVQSDIHWDNVLSKTLKKKSQDKTGITLSFTPLEVISFTNGLAYRSG
ncbi:hypothetical protein ACXJY6_01325 [Vibrio sp. RC27]